VGKGWKKRKKRLNAEDTQGGTEVTEIAGCGRRFARHPSKLRASGRRPLQAADFEAVAANQLSAEREIFEIEVAHAGRGAEVAPVYY
jgi:hypothetical protein